MDGINWEDGRYRVVLIGIADNAEAKRESFCKDVSEKYGISVPLLKKIIDRCPIILKKNLSLKKAEALAKVLRSFGAVVSVQEKRDLPAISLEFQELSPHRLALESSSLLRTQSGSWNVIGRAKNISQESLSDTWVLIELFSDLDEFLAFEEVPILINPLPPGKASPFKAVFEGDLPVKKVSIMFKDSSGYALSTSDRRKKREWVAISFQPLEPDIPAHPVTESQEPSLLNLEEGLDVQRAFSRHSAQSSVCTLTLQKKE